MTDGPTCLMNLNFNIQDDTDVEQVLRLLEAQEAEDTTIRLAVQCLEEHFYLFRSEHYVMQRLHICETLVLFVEELIIYCRLYGIPCWLDVTIW